MKYNQTRYTPEHERGSTLIGVLILLSLAILVTSTALSSVSLDVRSMFEAEKRSVQYYRAEDSLGRSVSWLRNNSNSLVSPFSRTNFYTTFDRTTPTIGSNDTSLFSVASKIKRQGTTQSVILTNSALISAGYFPTTINPNTGASFNPLTQFARATLGNDIVRVTLVDAIATDPTKDYGDPDSGNAAPQTDFYPVYRVDSMDSIDRGAHVFSYVVGNLVSSSGTGFYGQNLASFSQSCDSYISNNGAYSDTTKRANCPIGSNSTLQIHQSTKIYGTASTNGAINGSTPYGGKVCADFTSNCPTPGTSCAGSSCAVPVLPTYQPWNTYCPTNQGNTTISSNTTLSVAGNSASQKCWNSVTISNNTVLSLNTTTNDYFIDTLTFQNNSNSQLSIVPSPITGTINLYVRTITGNTINGNQAFNSANKPYQFRIHYLGTNALTINGNSQIKAFITAPYASVTFSGSNEFYGGIKALSLTTTGSAGLHFDESGDVPTLSDTQYTTRGLVERYR